MNQAITFIVTFAISQLIFLILRQRLEIKELKQKKELIERSRDRWEKYYKDYIQKLESRVDELMKMRVIGNPKVSQDMVDAVRYAMKKSHPDNGGNAEDFVRFKKCYEELARR